MGIEQVVNYSHLFPTRYNLDLEGIKGTVSADTFKEPSQREDSKKTIKKLFEDRYLSGKNKWFFTPLRVSHSPYISSLYLLVRSSECTLFHYIMSSSLTTLKHCCMLHDNPCRHLETPPCITGPQADVAIVQLDKIKRSIKYKQSSRTS